MFYFVCRGVKEHIINEPSIAFVYPMQVCSCVVDIGQILCVVLQLC